MNCLSRIFVIVCSVLFLGAGVASADTMPAELTFTLSGPVTATFQLPSQLSAPSIGPELGFGFVIPSMQVAGFGANGVNLMINGAPSADFLAFYNATGDFHGGFAAFQNAFVADFLLIGGQPQLYSGPETSPIFSPGTFTLTSGNSIYTLTISGGSAVGTPEPSATILLSIGLLALGLTILGYKRGFALSAS
jgi:hypothetical protein